MALGVQYSHELVECSEHQEETSEVCGLSAEGGKRSSGVAAQKVHPVAQPLRAGRRLQFARRECHGCQEGRSNSDSDSGSGLDLGLDLDWAFPANGLDVNLALDPEVL